jgi:hypothetical protein
MKQHKFLLKPLFFIFNLVFATWLVLTIEKIQPSDFGRNASFFEKAPKPRTVSLQDQSYLMSLSEDYKTGRIDSVQLRKKLEEFLKPLDEKISADQK